MVWGGGGGGVGAVTGHRGKFNDTVFEVLGAENSKNDVVELWRGGRGTGGHERRGGSSTTLFLRFWGLKTPKTMSLNSGVGGSRPKRRIYLVERRYSQHFSPWPNG